ncbi:F-box/kelch-repeat protein At1g57790-like [Carex rostrata]
MPIDMVQLLSEKLLLKDSDRLQAVCKPWMNPSNPIKEEQVWLMYCPKKLGTCEMYNPSKDKQFTLNLKKLYSNEPSRLLFSKDGWVLALQGCDKLYLLNPFTNDFHHLPILEYPYSYSGIAMSCAPNSSSCVVFAVVGPPRGEFTRIIAWHYGQEEWYHLEFDNNFPFPMADNNPVFINGKFYCLGRLGNLGVFNPEKNTWRVLDKPSPIYSDLDQAPEFGTEYCYLLECNGDLISVFRAVNMDYVRVYKLDRSKNMSWTRLEDLGDLTLFLDFRTSIARALPCKSYSNKLYLPRLHDETNTATFYYNLKIKMHNPDFKCLREPYNCVWMEPNLCSLK